MILTQAWKQFFKTKITLHSKILTDFHGFAEKINLAATGTDHQQLIHNTAFNLFALVNEENHQVSFCHHTTQPLQAPTGMPQMHSTWHWLVSDPLPHHPVWQCKSFQRHHDRNATHLDKRRHRHHHCGLEEPQAEGNWIRHLSCHPTPGPGPPPFLFDMLTRQTSHNPAELYFATKQATIKFGLAQADLVASCLDNEKAEIMHPSCPCVCGILHKFLIRSSNTCWRTGIVDLETQLARNYGMECSSVSYRAHLRFLHLNP